MSATTLAKTFTRTAECGHEYEATTYRGKRILCDGCKAAREDIRIGAWVTLGGGAVGQIWAEGERAGSWWIATGRAFVGMSDASVIRNLITTATPDDVDALFESGAVGAVVGLERVVLEIAEGLDALEAEITGEAAPADPRPVAVTEAYRRRTHDVAETETGNGSVTTACGTLLATDPQGGAARRGASLGELHGQDRIGELMCPGCVAVAETSAAREVLATMPPPAADTAVTGIPAPMTVLACGHSTDDVLMRTSRTTCRHDHPSRGGGPAQTYPVLLAGEIQAPAGPVTQAAPSEAASGPQVAAPVATVTTDVQGFTTILVRDDVAAALLGAQSQDWTEHHGRGAGYSGTFQVGTPVAVAVESVLGALAEHVRQHGPIRGVGVNLSDDGRPAAGWSGVRVAPAGAWDLRGWWRQGIPDGARPMIRSVGWTNGWPADGVPAGWEFYG